MKPVKKILIVGGGTAGWLSACFLQKILNKVNPRSISISLIESEDIGIIGVGEATVPTMRKTLNLLGIHELEFIKKCNATLKHAIKFVDWLHEPGAEDNFYYHPFQRPHPFQGYDLFHYWQAINEGKPSRYAFDVTPQADLCENYKSPKLNSSKPFEAPITYAYHLDAVLFGRLLKEKSIARGVNHVIDTVVDVEQDDEGNVCSVLTEQGNRLEADLFIDCSGFRGLLINKTLKTPYTSYKKELFCDRAITIQIPTKAEDPIKPYTTSTALSNGWVWDINLQDRRGTGYVYSSQFISDQDAESELRQYLGLDKSKDLSARYLQMRVGRHDQMWNKNVVAIGLAAGFIEPLESSGIYLVEMALKLLADFFPHAGINASVQNHFNQRIVGLYDEIMNFLVLHYCLTRREDTSFWRANKYNKNIPDGLAEDLDMWKYRLPTQIDRDSSFGLFNHETYQYILAGMDRLPETCQTIFNKKLLSDAKRLFSDNRKHNKQAVEVSPSHNDYLNLVRAS